MFHFTRGDFRRCSELADEGMEFANRLNDRGMVMEALKWVGQTMLYRADFAGARDRFATAVDEYDSPGHTLYWAAYTNQDPGVANRCHLAMSLWHLGYPDQALTISRQMHELARAIGHPFTLGYALHHAGLLRPVLPTRGRGSGGRRGIPRDLGRTGVCVVDRVGDLLQGCRDAPPRSDRRSDSLDPQGRPRLAATGAELILPVQLSALGDAYMQAGRFEDARQRWTRDWQSRKRTTSASRRPSCTASKASCCWRSRRTKPLSQRNSSAVPSRSPDASGAGPGSCGPRRALPGSGNGRPVAARPAPRWRPSSTRTRKVSRRRTSWRLGHCWKLWPEIDCGARVILDPSSAEAYLLIGFAGAVRADLDRHLLVKSLEKGEQLVRRESVDRRPRLAGKPPCCRLGAID